MGNALIVLRNVEIPILLPSALLLDGNSTILRHLLLYVENLVSDALQILTAWLIRLQEESK